VLQGKTISYYADERDNRPRRTIDLSHCIVRNEGTKKGGMYHIICIYLASEVILDPGLKFLILIPDLRHKFLDFDI
jgi:hypothetical protein